MNRTLAFLSSAALVAATASAQCFEPDFGTLMGTGDDILLGKFPMNMTFPMGGTLGNYTHLQANTNGCIFLWDATATVGALGGGYSTSAATIVNNLRGAAGGAPRIAAYWNDLNILAANNGGVWINNSYPGKCVVTWANAVHWNVAQTPFTVQAQLFANGEVHFFYDGILNNNLITPVAGISAGGAIADPGVTDLSVGAIGTSTSRIVYQTFPTALTWDLANTAVMFLPNGGGGYDSVPVAGPFANCVHAKHEVAGTGCHVLSDSLYQLFADAAVASPGLTGQSVSFTPAGGGYLMQWGGGSYVAPATPTNVFSTPTDDGETIVDLTTLSLPALNTPQGPQSQLRVHSNGILSWGAAALSFPGGNNYTPTVPSFLNSNNGGIYAWHDYNESETGSGRIVREVVGSVLYVTWDGVENYSTPLGPNPGTMQYQIDTSTGVVTVVWQSVDADTTSIYGSAHLVGWTAPGTTPVNGGSQNLAAVLPQLVGNLNVPPMALSAAPIPVINPSTLVTYTATNLPEFIPSSGVYLSTMFLSVVPLPGGFDLTGILTTVPGCSAYIGTLDLDLGAQVTFANSASWTFTFDNVGFGPGNVIGAQAVALFDGAFPLPNGESGGFLFSNGIVSTTELQ
ncbi:MAG: hypothetical protein KF830_02385 [Planctomycetes bacterium]|nr:hypothetical protein [Planctomycetota bacterium]